MQQQIKHGSEKSIKDLAGSNPGKSGVIALSDGYDAFAARIMIADNAVSSLDIQYYIWENDLTGTLLIEALYRAAERGVRIRLLLDDHKTTGLDDMLATLHSHPHIEIRLFNPFRQRRWRILGNFTDFYRLNRRMHNKSFTADNHVTIIGGRNIGDEYFNAGQEFLFIDLDILVIGCVVEDVSRDFERFWTNEMTCPLHMILRRNQTLRENELSKAVSIIENNPEARNYLHVLKNSPLALELHELPFEWTKVQLVSDDPSKAVENFSSGPELLQEKLFNILDMPSRELLLIVPYFVPGKKGVEFFTRLRKQNVQVKILTNSFNATDIAIIHAGYAKHRKKLLEAGVILYELKGSSEDITVKYRRLTGTSSSSLHAKTFCIDRSEVFVGSCNFDPRSSLLNTEMGVLIKSSAMAQKASDLFAHSIPARSYEVRLNDKGKLLWIENSSGTETIHEKEPGMDIIQRAWVSFFSKLPIEWLL